MFHTTRTAMIDHELRKQTQATFLDVTETLSIKKSQFSEIREDIFPKNYKFGSHEHTNWFESEKCYVS